MPRVNRANPYTTDTHWSQEAIAAYADMPKVNGHVVALQYLEKREALRMENEWREWCRRHPRELWPIWLDSWPDFKRRRKWD